MELLEIENLQALMFGPPLYAVYAQILAASQLRKCDNIDSGDKMNTTAGSRALINSKANEDAFIVKKLRE